MIRVLAELVAISGSLALLYGVYQWSQPSAWIAGGLLAMVVGVFMYRNGMER